MQGLFVAEANWQEVHKALEAGGIAILPVSAACKEHGLHLPMNTDLLQAQWLCKSLAEKCLVVVWPSVSYGYYPAFTDYPGSCSLSCKTFENSIVEILDDILCVARRKILVVNTGISTIPPLQAAIERTFEPGKIQLANVYDGSRVRSVITQIEEQPNGSHADEIETSIMLAIAPHKVCMDEAVACTRRLEQGPLNRTNPADPNYSPSGVYGDPRLASKEKGELLIRAMLDDLLEYT
ncbi:MAG: creatininase family protein [Pseudomonadota bacterium]